MLNLNFSWHHGNKSAVELISGTSNNVLVPMDSSLINYKSALEEYGDSSKDDKDDDVMVKDVGKENGSC